MGQASGKARALLAGNCEARIDLLFSPAM